MEEEAAAGSDIMERGEPSKNKERSVGETLAESWSFLEKELEEFKDGGVAIIDQIICSHAKKERKMFFVFNNSQHCQILHRDEGEYLHLQDPGGEGDDGFQGGGHLRHAVSRPGAQL